MHSAAKPRPKTWEHEYHESRGARDEPHEYDGISTSTYWDRILELRETAKKPGKPSIEDLMDRFVP